jgi:hypothetical protein
MPLLLLYKWGAGTKNAKVLLRRTSGIISVGNAQALNGVGVRKQETPVAVKTAGGYLECSEQREVVGQGQLIVPNAAHSAKKTGFLEAILA